MFGLLGVFADLIGYAFQIAVHGFTLYGLHN